MSLIDTLYLKGNKWKSAQFFFLGNISISMAKLLKMWGLPKYSKQNDDKKHGEHPYTN